MSIINDEWDFRIDLQSLEKNMYLEFKEKVKCRNESLQVLLKGAFQTKNKLNNKENTIQNYDSELKVLLERNKELKQDLDEKLEDLAKNQAKYQNYKQDQKLLSQEIKDTYEAFLMAKKYYKKFLKMYYTIESTSDEKQVIFLQFFTESKKDSDNYSARFRRDIKTGSYELMETTPKIKTISEIQRKLMESKDMPGALCYIRQMFIKMKSSK